MILKLIILVLPLALLIIIVKKKNLALIFTVIGAIIGLIFVKGAVFSIEEQLGWEFFWDAVRHHHISVSDFKDIASSTTFIKSTLGLFTGGIIGYFIGKPLKENILKESKK